MIFFFLMHRNMHCRNFNKPKEEKITRQKTMNTIFINKKPDLLRKGKPGFFSFIIKIKIFNS